MDTSKEYIELCDCDEIQSLRGNEFKRVDERFQHGDYFYLLNDDSVHIFIEEHTIDQNWQTDSVWLPRLDQLYTLIQSNLNKDWRIICYPGQTGIQKQFLKFYLKCLKKD